MSYFEGLSVALALFVGFLLIKLIISKEKEKRYRNAMLVSIMLMERLSREDKKAERKRRYSEISKIFEQFDLLRKTGIDKLQTAILRLHSLT